MKKSLRGLAHFGLKVLSFALAVGFLLFKVQGFGVTQTCSMGHLSNSWKSWKSRKELPKGISLSNSA